MPFDLIVQDGSNLLVRAVGAAAFVPVQTPVRDDGRIYVMEDVDPLGRYVLMHGGYGEYIRLWLESGRIQRLADLPDGRSDRATVGPQTVIAAALAPDGYPITAPLTPLWWHGMVVGLGTDGTVIGYQPGKSQSSLIDLGLTDIHAFAAAP